MGVTLTCGRVSMGAWPGCGRGPLKGRAGGCGCGWGAGSNGLGVALWCGRARRVGSAVMGVA